MDYTKVSVYKEKQLEQKVTRLEILLHNAITVIEEEQIYDIHKRMLDNLGLTEKEYKEVMEN